MPTNLDELIDLALQTGGETAAFDFKEQLNFTGNGEHKLKLLKAIGAFGNTDHGGHIFVGISDARQLVGISADQTRAFDQTVVQRMTAEYFAPPPAIQVRQHSRGGKNLVVIEVAAFDDVPSVVKRSDTQGREKLQAGTFLTRTAAAESALLCSDAEVRKLCDAIASRRAQRIAEFVQRAAPQRERAVTRANLVRDSLNLIKAEADRMAEHARNLNVGLYHHSADQYLPLLFRPSVLESALNAVISEIAADKMLLENLGLLRTAAAAADEIASRILVQGGDARPLVSLVLSVLNTGRMVSAAIATRLEGSGT
jgi:Putative DNA-binding domain